MQSAQTSAGTPARPIGSCRSRRRPSRDRCASAPCPPAPPSAAAPGSAGGGASFVISFSIIAVVIAVLALVTMPYS